MDATGTLDYKARADELFAKQDYAAAAEDYRKVYEQQPTNSQAMRGLGFSLVMAKQLDEGTEILKNLAALYPMDPEARYAYGYALGAKQQWLEAITELDAALYLQPNHVAARQGLIYCLLNGGQQIAGDDKRKAEEYLERAYKMDQKNPHLLAALMNFMISTNQVGKGVKVYQDADDKVKKDPAMQQVEAKMQADTNFSIALKQAQVQSRAANVIANPAGPTTSTLQTIPCPNCRQQIMSYAAICPHCNFQLRATGTFAGRQETLSSTCWQEVAYYIFSALWTIGAGLGLFFIWQTLGFEGLGAFLAILEGGRAAIGIGLLFKNDTVGLIAKILCYMTLFSSAYGMMGAWGMGNWLSLILNAVNLAVAGMMVYLINFNLDA